MNRLIKEIEKRKTLLRKIIFMIQKDTDEKPEGRLRISRNRFFQVTKESGRNGYYIRKGNMQLVKSLAQKDYDNNVLKYAEAELESLEKGFIYTGKTFEDVYEGLSDIRKKLIRTAYPPDDIFVRIWLDRPYEKFSFKDDAPCYRTGCGVRVRSKSEWIIASILEKYNIPYLYEFPVTIEGKSYRPDFTILKMPERKVICWEHMGMLDDTQYCSDNINKINKYSEYGIVMGDNLFITMENKDEPLNTSTIEKIVKTNFLNEEV